MKITHWFSLVIALSSFGSSFYAFAAPQPVTKLYISSGFTAPISTYYYDVLMQVDKKLPNLQIVFEELTAERSIDLVNRGVNDGECCRIRDVVQKQYGNLVSVTESFMDAKFVAFSKSSHLNIKTFDDIKPYSTATVVGWKILVNNLNRINPREKYIVSSPEQMMKMLKMDRIEVAMLGYESGLMAMQRVGLEGVHSYLNPPLATKTLYLMLHKKNVKWIKPISDAIRELKQDGTIDRIYKQHFLTK